MRAAWVATVSNIDWPSSTTLTTAQQQSQIRTILDHLKNTRMNVALVQVRPQCDSFYQSALEPWSQYLEGTMGQAPNPFYDPLQYWIQEGKARGIEIHAWINPYRAKSGTGAVSDPTHVTNAQPEIVRTYGSNKWMDPGHPDSVARTRAAVLDIVTRYDIDGLVLDDYFYPYPISGQAFPDDETYNAYVAAGGLLSRPNWRRQNVDNLIQGLYTSIKQAKPHVKFGIAPFGIWRPNNPPGVTGLDAYASIYADSKKWLNQGWCDYFSPQLYWEISSSGQPYVPLLNWWLGQNTQGRIVAPSNICSNIDGQGTGWPVSELTNQVIETRIAGALGNIFFSMKVIRDNREGFRTALQTGVYSQPVIGPHYPWLDAAAPEKPRVKYSQVGSTVTFNIVPSSSPDVGLIAVQTRYGNAWTNEVLPSATSSFTRPAVNGSNLKLHSVWVYNVDRCGNLSQPTKLAFMGPRDTR
jgi:uncharacterized lipoprotein YddW (UPF0748 family)